MRGETLSCEVTLICGDTNQQKQQQQQQNGNSNEMKQLVEKCNCLNTFAREMKLFNWIKAAANTTFCSV